MYKTIYLTLAFIILAVVLSDCRSDSIGPSQGQPNPGTLTPLEKNIASSDNAFGVKLFSKINETQQNKNVFISPFSVSMAFGMLLNGANGPTLDSLEQTLGDNGLTLSDINNAYKNSSAYLTDLDAHVVFQNANSIWYRNGFQVLPEFLNVNRSYFDADVTGLDFNLPSAVQTINTWVDTKTYGKIPEVMAGPIPPEAVMYLINAIYFKGTWTYTFDTAATKEASFTCSDGSTTSCKFMSQSKTYAYYGDNTLQAIDLPYGDRSYSMTVILPAAGTSIDQFASTLTIDQWNAIIGKLYSTKADLFMPKFTLNYSRLLNDDLKALGMGIVFDPNRADLSRIRQSGGLCVSGVLHKTYVDVNEEGTEAAAVTVIGVTMTVVVETPQMRINRPFIFAIREHQSGTILFIGKVDTPAGS